VAKSDTCSTSVRIEVVRSTGGNLVSPYPLGITSVLVTAADESGNQAHCATSVTVRDTGHPALTLVADPHVLWPPNHRLVPVQVAWTAQDTCDAMPAVRLVAAASSEPDDAEGEGDGRTRGDIAGAEDGTPDAQVSLRAERAAAGTGRVYELVYTATDASGNSVSALAVIMVPHDQGSGPEPLLMRVEPIGVSGPANLSWNLVPGAEAYDLLAGDVSGLRVVDDELSLGPVRVLARGIGQTSWSEGPDDLVPAPGRAVFYVAQYRDAQGAKGYGTASGSWPRAPALCEGGCP
jgi:hypothetical protein